MSLCMCMRACTCICTLTNVRSLPHTRARTRAHKQAHMHTHVHSRKKSTHTYTHTHTHTQTHTHSHTHTHTHTLSLSLVHCAGAAERKTVRYDFGERLYEPDLVLQVRAEERIGEGASRITHHACILPPIPSHTDLFAPLFTTCICLHVCTC